MPRKLSLMSCMAMRTIYAEEVSKKNETAMKSKHYACPLVYSKTQRIVAISACSGFPWLFTVTQFPWDYIRIHAIWTVLDQEHTLLHCPSKNRCLAQTCDGQWWLTTAYTAPWSRAPFCAVQNADFECTAITVGQRTETFHFHSMTSWHSFLVFQSSTWRVSHIGF